ncbi:hypothetical protein [Sorangium sp. So ce1153]|uniref:hypothetical protein n=1 Tax=Sorangium sp. So ce1153 TaxID=3133333 RepID=UPI003F5F8B7C
MASAARTTGVVYERRRPEKTTLYEIVRDNVETLYGAIDDGAIAVRIPKHAKKELEAYLDCGLLCRGFVRPRCERCEESRLVAFSTSASGTKRFASDSAPAATSTPLMSGTMYPIAVRASRNAAARSGTVGGGMKPRKPLSPKTKSMRPNSTRATGGLPTRPD